MAEGDKHSIFVQFNNGYQNLSTNRQLYLLCNLVELYGIPDRVIEPESNDTIIEGIGLYFWPIIEPFDAAALTENNQPELGSRQTLYTLGDNTVSGIGGMTLRGDLAINTPRGTWVVAIIPFTSEIMFGFKLQIASVNGFVAYSEDSPSYDYARIGSVNLFQASRIYEGIGI